MLTDNEINELLTWLFCLGYNLLNFSTEIDPELLNEIVKQNFMFLKGHIFMHWQNWFLRWYLFLDSKSIDWFDWVIFLEEDVVYSSLILHMAKMHVCDIPA